VPATQALPERGTKKGAAHKVPATQALPERGTKKGAAHKARPKYREETPKEGMRRPYQGGKANAAMHNKHIVGDEIKRKILKSLISTKFHGSFGPNPAPQGSEIPALSCIAAQSPRRSWQLSCDNLAHRAYIRTMTPIALKGRKIGLGPAVRRAGGGAILVLGIGLGYDASLHAAHAAALDWSPSALPKAPNATAPDWEIHVCGKVAKVVEQVFGIPPELLAAVARAESGRWVDSAKASFAWPWTVTAEGEGRYFATKAQAVDAVRRLKARGTRNIDVGCLQINMQYHPKAFPSLEAAFDPMENAIFAAQFLTGLHADTHSWTRAVQLYHSSNPDLHNRYAVHVGTLWFDEFRRAHAAELAQKKRDAAPADSADPDEATAPAR
jgi:hypothetical protein